MKVVFIDKWKKLNMEYSMGNMKDVSIDGTCIWKGIWDSNEKEFFRWLGIKFKVDRKGLFVKYCSDMRFIDDMKVVFMNKWIKLNIKYKLRVRSF